MYGIFTYIFTMKFNQMYANIESNRPYMDPMGDESFVTLTMEAEDNAFQVRFIRFMPCVGLFSEFPCFQVSPVASFSGFLLLLLLLLLLLSLLLLLNDLDTEPLQTSHQSTLSQLFRACQAALSPPSPPLSPRPSPFGDWPSKTYSGQTNIKETRKNGLEPFM